jgi:hypothetical protein
MTMMAMMMTTILPMVTMIKAGLLAKDRLSMATQVARATEAATTATEAVVVVAVPSMGSANSSSP